MERGLRAVELLNVPQSPKVLVFKGKCLLLLGHGDEGCSYFHACTELYPNTSFAWNNAAICDLREPSLRPFQREKLQKALDLAYRHEHKEAAQQNLDAYVFWQNNNYQGTFDGTLVY